MARNVLSINVALAVAIVTMFATRGAFAIVTDVWDNDYAFPAADIAEIEAKSCR